jgi:hypothetical protein
LHLLLTGEPGEWDRRLVVDEVPSYGMHERCAYKPSCDGRL